MTTLYATPTELAAWLAEADEEDRRRREARCRGSLADFFREGWHVVEGRRLIWGRHLQAQCDTAQAFAEGWLVAHGRGSPAMIERQRGHWRRHGVEPTDETLLELVPFSPEQIERIQARLAAAEAEPPGQDGQTPPAIQMPVPGQMPAAPPVVTNAA